MQMFDRIIPALLAIFTTLIVISPLAAQSSDQNFPTPVTSNEISGTIKARDIGDARLTSYYYQFDGDQGDLFINVMTRNFTGDIDVFTQSGLKPLTKMVVYADFGESETGRVIYLRKPEKMILRIQGRTPGDDAATFRIKFAGGFVASTQTEPTNEPALPNLTAKNESGIRVNSVGPGAVVTPINKAWIDNPKARGEVESHIPMSRPAAADEIASVFAFLASDDASYVTGQTIFACGGLTLYPEFRVAWSSGE